MNMQNRMAHYVRILFTTAIVVLSSATSFLYFVAVFQPDSSSALAGLASGIVGVLVTDAAALSWMHIYLHAAENNDQRALAAAGAFIGATGSMIASFAYLLGITPLVAFPPSMAAWSTIALAVIIVAHFVLVMVSNYRSNMAQIADTSNALMADATNEMLQLTDRAFRSAIPNLAQQNADRMARQLAAKFSAYSDTAQLDGAAAARFRASHNGTGGASQHPAGSAD